MQISRHWRIKQQRYRLEGVRFQNGEISLQNRPTPNYEREQANTPTIREPARVTVVGR